MRIPQTIRLTEDARRALRALMAFDRDVDGVFLTPATTVRGLIVAAARRVRRTWKRDQKATAR